MGRLTFDSHTTASSSSSSARGNDREAIFTLGRRGDARGDRLGRASFLLLIAPIEELLE
jgi:hypothetical protein